MKTHLKRMLLKLRLAVISVETEESNASIKWHESRLEQLAKKEIELRIDLHRVSPIRASVVYPR